MDLLDEILFLKINARFQRKKPLEVEETDHRKESLSQTGFFDRHHFILN